MADHAIAVSTVVGSLTTDGSRMNAKFRTPRGLDFTKDDGIVIVDRDNHCIRKVTLHRRDRSFVQIQTIAGVAGLKGYRDGDADQALFSNPYSVAVGSDSLVYVADTGNRRIRTVDSSGRVRTLAGSGERQSIDGHGASASFTHLRDITTSTNNLQECFYISDGHCVRKMDQHGTVSTIAGQSGTAGLQDGLCSQAKFNTPAQVACSGDGETLYVADCYNHAVRAIMLNSRSVKTIVGGKGDGSEDGSIAVSKLCYPVGVTVDIGSQLFVSDHSNNKVRIVSLAEGTVDTLVGRCEMGLEDGDSQTAKLQLPQYLLLDPSTHTLYFTQDHCIRKVSLPMTLAAPEIVASLGDDQMSLVDNKELADVVFQVDGKNVYAVKSILHVRSPYFAGLFSSGMKESHPCDGHISTVAVEDAGYNAFRLLIVYLTTDKVSLDPQDWRMACELLVLSDRFLVDKLKIYCEHLLGARITVENAVELLRVSNSHNASLLKEQVICFICQQLSVMRERPELEELPSSLLVDIMKKQDL